jgi:hypothetical protein
MLGVCLPVVAGPRHAGVPIALFIVVRGAAT